MLRLKLMENNEYTVTFNYYPENHEEFGTVIINRQTGEVESYKISVNDKVEMHLCHAISKIREFFENGEYQTETIVAWY